jgi:transposase
MSQSLLYHAFGVREGYKYRRTEYVEGRVEFHLEPKMEKLRCPHCEGDALWRRGSRQRRFKTLPIGAREVVLVVEVPRCQCQGCQKCFEHLPPLPTPIASLPVCLPGSCAT